MSTVKRGEEHAMNEPDTNDLALLVGEANPYGGDPSYALYPAPEGSAGGRLCSLIMGLRIRTYRNLFARANLCPHRWSVRVARDRAAEIRFWNGPIVLLGRKVSDAFGVPYEPFGIFGEGKFLVLPHPSGRNLFWNRPDAIGMTRRVMASFYPAIASNLGEVD